MTMTIKRAFTLFEIVLCIAILGLIAGGLGWQTKTMVSRHHFHKNLDMFLTDLRKIQIMALSSRADIQMEIFEKNGKISYRLTSDEKLPFIKGKEVKLLGVKRVKNPQTLTVYSTGRIEPTEPLYFFQENGEGAMVHLGSEITLKFLQPSDENS